MAVCVCGWVTEPKVKGKMLEVVQIINHHTGAELRLKFRLDGAIEVVV